MMPRDEKHLLHQEPAPAPPQPADPTRGSKTWAIALVVAAVFLLAAAGIVTWLLMRAPAQSASQATNAKATEVKDVTLVPPVDMPSVYIKDDKSLPPATRTYYYDNGAACGFTVGGFVTPAQTPVKEAAVQHLTSGVAQGFTATATTDGDAYTLADAADTATGYKFAVTNIDYAVNVPGVAFTKQSNVVLYKQFGTKVVLLSYACKAETWAQKQPELAAIAQKFTVKTER